MERIMARRFATRETYFLSAKESAEEENPPWETQPDWHTTSAKKSREKYSTQQSFQIG